MAFPTDKDQYGSNDAIIRQTDCQYSFGSDAVTLVLKFWGTAEAAVDLAASFRKGTRVTLADVKAKFAELANLSGTDLEASGKVTESGVVTRELSGFATVSVRIPYQAKLSPSSDEEPEERKVVKWSEKSTDYEFPLEVYAGDVDSSSTQYANAGDFQAWKNEKDRNVENYKAFKYTNPEDPDDPVELEGRTQELAVKAYKGIESVRRAYPEVVRTTQYYNLKADADTVDATLVGQIDETPDLYETDDTPDAVWSGKFPDFSWLKASYDVDCEPTEYEKFWNVTVTETWIGIDTNERGEWDDDLYGTTARWKFAEAAGQEEPEGGEGE